MRPTIRHALATLAYRAAKVFRDVPDSFPFLELGSGVRTPLQILAHMADLMAFSTAALQEREPGERPPERGGTARSWDEDQRRFFDTLDRLDKLVASGAGSDETLSRLLQGPIADALTHVGQLSLLRRVAGSPIPGESFYRAEITVGRVGRDQVLPEE